MSDSKPPVFLTHPVDNPEQARLVRARTSVSARSFVARDTIVARKATQDDLIKHIAAGVVVEDATQAEADS